MNNSPEVEPADGKDCAEHADFHEDLDEFTDLIFDPSVDAGLALSKKISQLLDLRDFLLKDARRYMFLRGEGPEVASFWKRGTKDSSLTLTNLDAAIDAQLEARKEAQRMEGGSEFDPEFDAISHMLKVSGKFGLQVEVVAAYTWARAEGNSPHQSAAHALYEWDC